MFQEVIKWITPPEVVDIANELRGAADEIDSMEAALRSANDQLAESWQGGRTRAEVIEKTNNHIRDLRRMASELRSKANRIALITVWIIIMDWVEDHLGIND